MNYAILNDVNKTAFYYIVSIFRNLVMLDLKVISNHNWLLLKVIVIVINYFYFKSNHNRNCNHINPSNCNRNRLLCQCNRPRSVLQNTGGLAHKDDPLLHSAGRAAPMIYLLDALCACPFSCDICVQSICKIILGILQEE